MPSLADRIDLLLGDGEADRAGLRGVGFSFPALIDSTTARVTWTPRDKFEDSVDIDFRAWARESFGLPLALENDANMALLGEWRFGAGRGCDDLVQVTLGTGVGSAALLGGNLLRGKHFQAGCLGGFQVVNFDGQKRSNGYSGYVECEASTWVLPEIARSDPEFSKSSLVGAVNLDYETLFDHAERLADGLARRCVDRSIAAWSAAIVNLIHAYDPERVILSGGILQSADRIVGPVRTRVAELAHTPWGEVEVLRAEHIEDAALLGAWHAVEEMLR
jgi:glucokinase